MTAAQTSILLAVRQAENGVDYSARHGAVCPWCGRRTMVYKTMPWDDNTRIRYHRCTNAKCILVAMSKTIKSVEIDQSAGGRNHGYQS